MTGRAQFHSLVVSPRKRRLTPVGVRRTAKCPTRTSGESSRANHPGLDTRGSVNDGSNVKTPMPFARGPDGNRGLHVVIQ